MPAVGDRVKLTCLMCDAGRNLHGVIALFMFAWRSVASACVYRCLTHVICPLYRCLNARQSLAGTLKAAKRRKLLTYGPELLLQGTSDKEIIRMPKAAE